MNYTNREWIKETNDLYNNMLKLIVSVNQMPDLLGIIRLV